MQYISKEKAYSIIKKRFDDKNNNDYQAIPWIFVRVLRLLISDYDKLSNIDFVSMDRIIEASDRYLNGESLGEIFGKIEFYGRLYKTTNGVFDPRLSSEAVVNAVVKNIEPDDEINVLDLCCGVGPIAITIEKILKCFMLGVDINDNCISIARKNSIINDSNARFKQLDILNQLDQLNGKFDCIVSNPPYWTTKKLFENKDQMILKGNPVEAFDGGEDGLKFHKFIIQNAPKLLLPNGFLCLEIDDEQFETIQKLMGKDFKDIGFERDYRGIIRAIYGRLK